MQPTPPTPHFYQPAYNRRTTNPQPTPPTSTPWPTPNDYTQVLPTSFPSTSTSQPNASAAAPGAYTTTTTTPFPHFDIPDIDAATFQAAQQLTAGMGALDTASNAQTNNGVRNRQQQQQEQGQGLYGMSLQHNNAVAAAANGSGTHQQQHQQQQRRQNSSGDVGSRVQAVSGLVGVGVDSAAGTGSSGVGVKRKPGRPAGSGKKQRVGLERGEEGLRGVGLPQHQQQQNGEEEVRRREVEGEEGQQREAEGRTTVGGKKGGKKVKTGSGLLCLKCQSRPGAAKHARVVVPNGMDQLSKSVLERLCTGCHADVTFKVSKCNSLPYNTLTTLIMQSIIRYPEFSELFDGQMGVEELYRFSMQPTPTADALGGGLGSGVAGQQPQVQQVQPVQQGQVQQGEKVVKRPVGRPRKHQTLANEAAVPRVASSSFGAATGASPQRGSKPKVSQTLSGSSSTSLTAAAATATATRTATKTAKANASQQPTRKVGRPVGSSAAHTPYEAGFVGNYEDMLALALSNMQNAEGSKPRVLYDWMESNIPHLPALFRASAAQALKKGLERGRFVKLKTGYLLASSSSLNSNSSG
ncbi:hypothetical protein HDV05_003498 [Chytridiales sp. JEL 0842]|nr:hypothetical protein HDV05_003498 [Chytridiales sp. JEL 0842]